jgi:adenine-specific DNA-methyltransferase
MVKTFNGETLDITKQNIERLKELFPEVVTDGKKIDFDQLRAVLGKVVEDHHERYQFTWYGKKQAILGAQKPSKGTLRPVPEKSKNFETTENLYIEGDNLEVLKLLQKSYNNKIKVIYIDPPYNTGNDFVYKDNFKDGVQNYLEQTGQVDTEGNYLSTNTEGNGRFHTDWLNMMYPRLKLARNLLTDNGVIFISIDDNEENNLKRICDEVFGSEQYVATFPWRKRTAKSDVPFGVSQDYEWIICYAKSNTFIASIKGGNRKYYETPDLPNRPWRIHDLTKQTSASERPKSYFTIINPKSGKKYPANPNRTWAITEETFQKYYDENRIVFPDDYDFLNISRPAFRYFKEDDMKKAGDLFGYIAVSTNLPTEVGMTQDGTKDISDLFSSKIFGFPKPVELIKYLIQISTVLDKEAIVLDFFSGSATTAHAVMKLNAEDSGNRKFIMVQLPEALEEKSEAYKDGYRTICDIGEERICRAGEKVIQELVEKQKSAGMLDENTVDPESLDIGFKVLKLDTSNIREWNVDFDNLKDELDLYETPFIEDRTELDVVYEIMIKYGLELTYPIETFEVDGKNVYDIAFGNLFICLADNINTNIAQAIIAKRDEYGIETSSVVFSDIGFKGNDAEKLNCIELLKDAGYPEDNLLSI